MNWRRCAGRFAALLGLLLNIALLAACGDERIVFTTGLGRDDVFRIGGEVCTTAEFMVYLTNMKNRYESVYGAQIWDASSEGADLKENLKENVLAKCAQVKAMYLLAEEKGVELDDGESRKVGLAAAEYYDSLSDREKELLGVKPSAIERMYSQYALADKVYRCIIQDVNPEISDDEARTITVQHILLRTVIPDEDGNWTEISESEKAGLYKKASEIRRQAVEGADFLELAGRYSEDSAITYSFGKGQMGGIFEETAFSLETGEVSRVIETQAGYHIVKCITTFDRAETDANKLLIVEKRRREAFEKEYEAFVEPLTRQLNTKLWDEIGLPDDEEVTTQSFFEIYEKYFSGV